jgi:hypothetical protein
MFAGEEQLQRRKKEERQFGRHPAFVCLKMFMFMK